MAKEKKERILTERELARTDRVDELTERYAQDGYTRRDVTVSITAANVWATVFGVAYLIVFGAWFVARNGGRLSLTPTGALAFFPLFLLLIVVHEGLHGLTWGFFAENRFRSIEFGFIKEMLTPYCYCGEPLKKGAYLLGAFMPTMLLGILPGFVSVWLGSLFGLLLSAANFMGGGGDLMIIGRLLTYKTPAREVIFMDHPTEAGFLVFEK